MDTLNFPSVIEMYLHAWNEMCFAAYYSIRRNRLKRNSSERSWKNSLYNINLYFPDTVSLNINTRKVKLLIEVLLLVKLVEL